MGRVVRRSPSKFPLLCYLATGPKKLGWGQWAFTMNLELLFRLFSITYENPGVKILRCPW